MEFFARASFLRSGDTAHDLKTPLNVAVLNLELLRMRVRKLTGGEDEKVNDYSRAIDLELRRMAEIFDTFFVLSTPPRNDESPTAIDVSPISVETAEEVGLHLSSPAPAMVHGHEVRIRQAFRLFFHGASKILDTPGSIVSASNGDSASFAVRVTGVPAADDFELSRIFKFYYTDPKGSPDLSLAAARLIAETYGGELNATKESDKVAIELSLPLGDR